MSAALPRIDDVATAHRMFAAIAHAPNEVAVFAYLDRERRLLAMRHAPSHSIGSVRLPIRQVAADAIVFEASALLMAHNHPSGDLQPSDADIAATRTLDRALSALDIRLLDHLIVTRAGVTSFRLLGLL